MSNQTFLPEEYLAQKAERRTNLICIGLFLVVMAAVFGAFLVTNRQWASAKERTQAVNVQYQQAAIQIEELNELEKQKEAMLDKAELAAALVERVPRSILLAELINRMPPRLGLLELELESERIKELPHGAEVGSTGSLKPMKRAKTKAQVMAEVKKPVAPRYNVDFNLVGVAPTDLEVSKYLAELNSYPLLDDVTLLYSEEQDVEGRHVREFRISMKLNPDADVRAIDPVLVPRHHKNPMLDTVQLGTPGSTASAGLHIERGN